MRTVISIGQIDYCVPRLLKPQTISVCEWIKFSFWFEVVNMMRLPGKRVHCKLKGWTGQQQIFWKPFYATMTCDLLSQYLSVLR